MNLALLLDSVANGEPLTVCRPDDGELAGTDELAAAIIRLDALARDEMAGEAPLLVLPAAVWAAHRLFRACQFFVYRDIEGDVIRRDLAIECPAAPSPAVCYSVDLSLRYLPDLHRLASGIAGEDPLVAGLKLLAAAWPLSSVGIGGLDKLPVSSFIHDDALRRLYADRIIEQKDASRLSDPLAAEAVREAIGAFASLAPELAATLEIRSTFAGGARYAG